ncbi:MAG: hypothetical protein LBS27_10615 [Bifidobacteriaceae bacterium]|jgi:hypothetical protein|nr:hypothetical protein [Bifidobacteriaceae bacterium]
MALTVRLTAEADEVLKREARRTGRSQNSLVIEAIGLLGERRQTAGLPRVPGTPFVGGPPPRPRSTPTGGEALEMLREDRLR